MSKLKIYPTIQEQLDLLLENYQTAKTKKNADRCFREYQEFSTFVDDCYLGSGIKPPHSPK